MADLETIGRDSKIAPDDKAWLRRLADKIEDCGLYTDAIYLRQMVRASNKNEEPK